MNYFFALILTLLLSQSQAQIMYKTRYKNAIFAESFATSPVGSINYEHLPVRWQRSFLSTRIGVGFVPGVADNGVSLPCSVTYNFSANDLKGRTLKRVGKRCHPDPLKIENETFIELGGGDTFATYSSKETRNFIFGIIGIRTQIVFNIPPHSRVVFLRALFTPAYSIGKIEPRAGMGLGISL